MKIANSDEGYLIADSVRRRYGGVSDMTLWRWMADEDLKFPSPAMVVRRRRLWRVADLEKWEAEQLRAANGDKA